VDFDRFTRRVGVKIRQARWASGMTQVDLAASALTFRLLSALERGTGNPTLRTLFALAKELNVSVKELVDVEGDSSNREPLPKRKLSPPKPGPKPRKKRIAR
jgi:transcriptional regulator with XRE-family HTH domain